MKTKIFLCPLAILLLVVTTYQLKSQTWTPLTSGTTSHLRGVSAPSANTCYVAGASGKILKTINGGASWTQQTSGTSQDLYSIIFTDLNNGYAVGNNGTAIKTSNGGNTWSSMPVGTGTGVGFRGVYFFDSITGFIVGGTNGGGVPGTMLKTTNAGLTWTILTTSPASTNSLYSIFFTSSSDGYSAGFDGKVIKTTDGGTSWSSISTGNTNPLVGVVKFTSISTGFVQGLNGTILATNNSGIAWSALTSGTSDDLFGIDFYNGNNGSAVGGNVGANTGKIIVTTDGGITWAPVTLSPGTSTLTRVDFVDQNTGYVVGLDGTILKYSACPMANAGSSKTICSDSSVTIGGSPTAIGGASPYTYAWAPLTGLNFSTISNPTAYPITTTTYTVIITDNSGCIAATDSVLVTVYPLPTLNAGSPFSICLGENITLTAIGNASTYTWNNGISDGVSFTPATTATYIVTGTTNGCSQNDTVLVTVNPKPTVVTNNPATGCLPETVDLTLPAVTAGSTGGLTLTYFTDAGATILYPTPTTATSGTYYIVGTILATGCSDTTSVTVTVNPKPDVYTTAPSAVCYPATEDLTSSTVTVGSTTGLIFTYFTDAGATVSYTTPTTATSDTYYIVGTILATGCSDTTAVTVTINPKPTVVTTNLPTVCSPATVDLTLAAITNGSTTGLTFTYFTDSAAAVSYATPTNATSGTYYVVGIIPATGCSDTTAVTVTASPLPTVTANTNADTVCAGVQVTLTGGGTASSYTWTGGVTDAIGFAPGSTLTYTVTGTDGNNCSDTSSITITVNPAPIANAGPDNNLCSGDTVFLSGTGGISYLWTDGINSFTTSTILASPTTSTSYTLTVTDNSGCNASDIASVSVTAGKDLYGHVDFSGGNIVNGNVVIYRHKPVQTQFDTTQVAPLDSLGNYHFTGINPKNYLIKVFADTITYPTVIPTYYGNAFRWNGSAVLIVHHDCTVSDTLNTITMIELTGTGGGNGIIKGKIIKGNGFERAEGEPIPGVDIKLGKNPGGSVTATTSTNEAGDYTFSGVANGNYTIYVDIPGLGCDSSYTFTIDSINNQFLNHNYTADSSMIFITPSSGLGINSSTASLENKFNVYPNPVIGNTTIEYSILQMTEVKTTLEVYNLLGVKISSLVNATQQPGIYKYYFNPQKNNLNSGVYFISLTIDGKTYTKRIVVME